VNFSGSAIHNELVDLGKDAQGNDIPPITLGFNALPQRHTEGYPLGSYFHYPIVSYADANGDGLLSPSEVNVRTDTLVYLGNPFPKRELSFNTDLRFRDWLKFSTLLDYKGGHQMWNFTHANRCNTNVSNCAELYDVTTPLKEQAAIVALRSYTSMAGFVEDADFVKLREASLTFGLPREFAERFSARGLSLTLAGRNLHTWTKYTGLDPELNSQGQANFTTAELGTLPPNRMYTIRIDANF
ncbi:MAG: hypothetical protein JO040_03270, partial [Gemmatimonadetes bacterium]|nr:hypothetical protein [Gemmatimonadota bacterium]